MKTIEKQNVAKEKQEKNNNKLNKTKIEKSNKLDKKKIFNNVKKVALNVLKNNIAFILGVILIVYKAILLNAILKIEVKFEMISYSFIVALLLMCPIINKKNKFAYLYMNILYAILNFIVYANYLYYSYSTNFLSLYQIHNLQYTKEIGSGVLTLINIKNIAIFWIDSVIIAILSVFLYRKNKLTHVDEENTKKTKYKKFIKPILIVIIILLNISTVKNHIDSIYYYNTFNKSMLVKNASIYYYHYKDCLDYLSSLFIKEEVDEEKLKNSYEQNINEKVKETKYTGIAKDKNVIIVQMESLNEYIIGKKVNGKEITPNLNKFFNENIYCKDMFNQGLGTTADSEFEMENSMYPLENGYVFQKYYNNTWFDIYNTLRKEGYYTSFMHPNTSTFWNRDEVYNTGYKIDEYNDIKSFPNIEKAGDYYSDEGFFEEAVKLMNSYEGKFCTTLVTVTTHIPFFLDGISDLESKLTITKEDLEDYEEEIFKNYIISCNFVDYAFGKFINDLTETGLLDKSILVVYGDHGSGIAESYQMEKLYKENGLEFPDFEDTTKDTHVPFGIKIPGVNESYVIDRTVSKIDIKPTILDLLGVKDNFSIGQTIFSNKDYAFIKGLGYITNEYYYIDEKYYNRHTHEEIEETDEMKELLEKMKNEIYLSDSIIKNNLLKK